MFKMSLVTNCINNDKRRKKLTWFILGSHCLSIDNGRYNGKNKN